ESICSDRLEVEPDNGQALISLTLALAEQSPAGAGACANALGTIAALETRYARAYHAGIAWERSAKAHFHGPAPGSHRYAYEGIMQALRLFEEAERLRAPGNDDAILRWNASIRFLARHKELVPVAEEITEPILSE